MCVCVVEERGGFSDLLCDHGNGFKPAWLGVGVGLCTSSEQDVCP